MMIHQRRNAFRANTGAAERPGITLSSARLGQSYPGELQDISASGCKIAFKGNLAGRIFTGQVHDKLYADLPLGEILTAIEIRHVEYLPATNTTYIGARFYRVDGLALRAIERYVLQLQRTLVLV